MRGKVTLALLFAGSVLVCSPSIGRAAAYSQEKQSEPAEPYRWLMIEAGPIMSQPGGGERVMEICRRGARAVFNGLLLWDNTLWFRRLPDGYMQNARTVIAGLKELNFTLVLEMCPRGQGLAEWAGDPTVVEPRSAKPTPEERNYRYLCLAHPGVMMIWDAQLKRAKEIYDPDGWMLQYDELRVSGDDARCKASGKKPGQLLAEHAEEAIAMCRRYTPGGIVAIWNDMFDPHHNARPGDYYHVKGGFSGAWDGIDREVLVINWNSSLKSFDFWARRGNPQVIAGFYDGEMGPVKEAEFVRQARQRPGVVGYMYTTWQANFRDLQPYLALTGFNGRPTPVRRGKEKKDAAVFLDGTGGRK